MYGLLIIKNRYFTDKKQQIGFRSIEKRLPKWIDEAIDALSKSKA
ncbi:hypothetical protein TMUPMC115_1983 [Tetragenococcus muriaticus PMC-11-5]|uniref:Uncharacterized protein n=1 Tax=Tetragenococcus muriaticus PMC-11-5 TaxID=1302649 RepID=A0A091C0R6_9ENTE|nr:hypothetical protein TMUPMC115_1983 [Tetragenococcus muriaticus PMC-11-5]